MLRIIAITGLLAASFLGVQAQQNQTRNLTPDGFWHNRYFNILSMASYGPYNTLCPEQTFTEETMRSNFPDSTLPPWEVIEEWNTPSGHLGFTGLIPEMNKVVVVFRGNEELEANLPLSVVPWSAIGINDTCQDCTVNEAAAAAYMEVKQATNDFAATRERYAGAGLVYAITGLGFGGMLSSIHAVDYNHRRIAYYHHSIGAPRTFNQAGSDWYNMNFNGEAGERAVINSDNMGELIPASADYANHGTTFFYYGLNETNNQPNWRICWPDDDPLALNCQPQPYMREGVIPSPMQDHYGGAFSVVTQCGPPVFDFDTINAFIRANVPGMANADLPSPSSGGYGGYGSNQGNNGGFMPSRPSSSTRASFPTGYAAFPPPSPSPSSYYRLARWA